MKRIVVLGAGESGTGAALLAKAKGSEVFVSDKSAIKEAYKRLLDEAKIEWEELQHTDFKVLRADEVIKSPGIPDKAPIVKLLIEQGTPIISEIEFAGRYTDAKMICITGSNGKTTTTMLIYHLLQTAGYSVGLAGNVGKSLALQVIEDRYDYYVVELSSFQLDNMYQFRANVALLLNITPDHLDRYNYEMQNYIDSKMRILQNQTEQDVFIYWQNDPILTVEMAKRSLSVPLLPFGEKREGGSVAYVQDGNMCFTTPVAFTFPLGQLLLSGKHNLYNAFAATLAALSVGVPTKAIAQGLSDFAGVEHRLEKSGIVDGVAYINDSKATNVNSCFFALQSMNAPTVLIIGGTDKGNDYTEIEALVLEKVKALVFMGVDNSKLHQFFDKQNLLTYDAASMKEAVQIARSIAQPGDTVLLSPCCASFDLFQNYEDRGRQFKAEVEAMS